MNPIQLAPLPSIELDGDGLSKRLPTGGALGAVKAQLDSFQQLPDGITTAVHKARQDIVDNIGDAVVSLFVGL